MLTSGELNRDNEDRLRMSERHGSTAMQVPSSVQLKVRMGEPLRVALERAARQRGVSMNAEAVRRLEQSFETSREADLDSISRLLSMQIDLYTQVMDNAIRKLESAGISADDLIEGKQIAQMRAMLREIFDMLARIRRREEK
jgi:hypothetical protein